jgi:hypothetical protein
MGHFETRRRIAAAAGLPPITDLWSGGPRFRVGPAALCPNRGAAKSPHRFECPAGCGRARRDAFARSALPQTPGRDTGRTGLPPRAAEAVSSRSSASEVMTLGNMRANGVRPLAVSCGISHHRHRCCTLAGWCAGGHLDPGIFTPRLSGTHLPTRRAAPTAPSKIGSHVRGGMFAVPSIADKCCIAASEVMGQDLPPARQKRSEDLRLKARQGTRGRGRLLPVQRLGGMTDATAGVYRGARECGGVVGVRRIAVLMRLSFRRKFGIIAYASLHDCMSSLVRQRC